jgi:hypothetical protein
MNTGQHLRSWNWRPIKKNEIKPWLQKAWCIATPSAEYVQRMEDVLEVYQRPYDEKRPVICLDETNRQSSSKKHRPHDPFSLDKLLCMIMNMSVMG